MNLAEASALVRSATPKPIKAAVETGDSIPIRDSKNFDVQVFTLVKYADARFEELYQSHEGDGWKVTVGSKTRGFVIFERENELFALHLDKQSAHNPPNEG